MSTPNSKKTNIKDVARLAGVSIATVSRALKNPALVSPETLSRVRAAIEQSGYNPDSIARSLRTRRSGNIVVIFPDITQPNYIGIIRGIESAASQLAYSVLLGSTRGDAERERFYAQMVSRREADGIILLGPNLPFEIDYSRPVQEQLPPLVNSCEPVQHGGISKVLVDNVIAGRMATQHLIELGHKNIGIITGEAGQPNAKDRLMGYKQALQNAGVPVNEALIEYGDYGVESGVACTQALLKQNPRPTAIFCGSDNMAIGALKTLRDASLSVPGDISIIGFDDIWYSEYLHPPLTTVRQPLEKMGRMCMQILHSAISNESATQETVYLPCELVVRESCAPPAAAGT